LHAEEAGKKYNVLFIAIDDLRPELGCYGDTWIKSPNIDKLAEDGTLFERAYCQVPVCGASRASVLTGLRPTKTRFLNYGTWAQDDAPSAMTLPEEFRKNGYHCISNGKVFHHQFDNGDKSWSEPSWRPFLSERVPLNPESETMIRPENNRGPVLEAADVTDHAYHDGIVADKTIEDLRRMKKSGQPFFIACGFRKPHLPFYAPKKYWELYDPAEIELADNQYRPKNAPEALTESTEIHKYHKRNMEYNSEEWHRNCRHGYYACVSYVDAQVGRVMQALDDLGLRENTVVILWGDHGWHLGEHTFWSKHNLMHLATHAPLLVAGPGVKAGQRSTRLVEFVDIYPTLCDLAGITPANQGLQGTSFTPLLDNPDRPWKKAAFIRYEPGEGGATVVTHRYSYTEFDNGEKMLYDLEKDPAENVNIAGAAENQILVLQLSQMLKNGWESVLP
jgi:arylsulfatase A-like enzyme